MGETTLHRLPVGRQADSRRVDSPRGDCARKGCPRAPSAAGRHLVIPSESAGTKAGLLRKLIPQFFGRRGREHKMRSIFLFTVFLVMWDITGSEEASDISADDNEDKITLKCGNGMKWVKPNNIVTDTNKIELEYKDEYSGEYYCTDGGSKQAKIFVKLRTCDNCIQLEVGAITGIIIGDVLATILIGVAVYSVASQPKARGYGSGYSKASDRQNLLQNQQNDTYTALQGPSSEYSKLERRANRK